MSSAKTLNTYGSLAKVEAVYGVAETLALATDFLLFVERPDVEDAYIHDGSRVGRHPGTSGRPRRVAPSGKEGGFSGMWEGTGAGVAYTAAILPVNHVLMEILGMEAAIDLTVSSEKVTYTPESEGLDSATVRVHSAQEQTDLVGAYGESLSISAEGPVIPTWEARIRGIQDPIPVDLALPVIVYPTERLPAKAVNIGLSANAVTTLILRGFTFNYERELTPRADDNSTGVTTAHKGFTPGGRTATLELIVEAIALATFDPYSLWDGSTEMVVSFGVGATQYNKWTFAANQSILTDVDKGDDGATATWILSFELATSGYSANDEFAIVYD